MPDDDTTQASEASGASDQLALDEADAAAGYRTVVDETENLDPTDPNAAVCGDTTGDRDQFIGADTDDDGGVAAAGATLSGGGH